MATTKFSTAVAKQSLGADPIDNTPKGMTAAFVKILGDQEFEINEAEILRWCEFQFARRYRFSKPPGQSTITVDTLITNFRTYMGNWYDQHRKWLRANS